MITPTRIVFAHANCQDGTAAAYAAWRSFGSSARYHYLNYHDKLPLIDIGSDKPDVLMVDYWRPYGEILSLLDDGVKVTILDHHESAMIDALRMLDALRSQDLSIRVKFENSSNIWSDDNLTILDFCSWPQQKLEDFVVALKLRKLWINLGSQLTVHFDLDRSGAAIAWDEFNIDIPMPEWIRYVEDRDLWRWGLPGSEAVNEALGSLGQKFKHARHEALVMAIAQALVEVDPSQLAFVGFDPANSLSLSASLRSLCESTLLMHQDLSEDAIAEFLHIDEITAADNCIELLAAHGTPLIATRRDAVTEMCRNVEWCLILDHKVPIVAAPQHHSWVGQELCNMFVDVPFSMTYRSGGDGILKVDLRSKNGFRVNRVAQKLAGGGHPAAAGFVIQQIKNLNAGDHYFHVGLVEGTPIYIHGTTKRLGDTSEVMMVSGFSSDSWVVKVPAPQ